MNTVYGFGLLGLIFFVYRSLTKDSLIALLRKCKDEAGLEVAILAYLIASVFFVLFGGAIGASVQLSLNGGF